MLWSKHLRLVSVYEIRRDERNLTFEQLLLDKPRRNITTRNGITRRETKLIDTKKFKQTETRSSFSSARLVTYRDETQMLTLELLSAFQRIEIQIQRNICVERLN